MAKHIQKNDLTGTWNIDTVGDDWILAEKASIITSGTEAIDLGALLTDNAIRLKGDIGVSGLVGQAINIEADQTAIYLARTASIDAATINVGIKIDAVNAHVDNSGTIIASLTGIFGAAGSIVLNDGTIHADTGVATGDSIFGLGNTGRILGDVYGLSVKAGDLSIVNGIGGIIRGGDTAVDVTGEGSSALVNIGLIKGPTAISDAEGGLLVYNRGTIVGEVFLGDGEDRFDSRKGTLDGTVHGGDGDDVYVVSGTSIDISELFDEGVDTVRSAVSYTLGDNLEYVSLIGTKNVNATGNEVANTIYGNKGDNVLKGLAGSDYLASGAGDDKMIGGADDDVFEFNPKNGHDTIADFEDGVDTIFSNFIQTEDDVDAMLANHVTEINGGVLIAYGKNSLFIKGLDLDNLTSGDFILNF